MRYYFIAFLLLLPLVSVGQNILTIEGQSYKNSDDTWYGVNIPRDQPTRLTFNNNSIISANTFGYMLQAGDENVTGTNNNLDGEVITGNQFIWTGTDMTCITHGVFTGHNINAIIKYNYLDHVPMGIIRKSSNNMINTAGGVAYNIIKSGAVGINIKGMSNVCVYNNTLYTDRTPSQTWRGLIYIYTNTDVEPNSMAHGTRIFNNIFYTKYQTYCIQIGETDCLTGFESDYNVFYCETGVPVFSYCGSVKTFSEWQALGYDKHSVVINPDFMDLISFVPAKRLDYGTDLGQEWQAGLSVNAGWGAGDPAIALQNGTWQAGAVIYPAPAANMPPQVKISSPAKSTSFVAPATITIDALVTDTDGTIIKVEFYNGTTKLVERNTLPWSFTWKEVPEGTYSITASATDNSGSRTISDTVTVVVEKAAPAINQLPVVSIKSPENESSFEVPAIIYIAADATDEDGTVTKVEYFNSDVKIGESFSPPWTISFECSKACEYNIKAVVTDNLNAKASSSPLTIFLINKFEYPDLINLFPNPNNGQFKIDIEPPLPDKENTMTISSLTGQVLYNALLEKEANSMDFDLSSAATGNYILIITSGGRIVTIKKFIKN